MTLPCGEDSYGDHCIGCLITDCINWEEINGFETDEEKEAHLDFLFTEKALIEMRRKYQ